MPDLQSMPTPNEVRQQVRSDLRTPVDVDGFKQLIV